MAASILGRGRSTIVRLWLAAAVALPALAAGRAAAQEAAAMADGDEPLLPEAEVESAIGQSIVAIDMDAPAEEDLPTLLALTDLEPGYLVDMAPIQAAIKRLYALGRFSQVTARLVPTAEAGAFVLRFELVPIVRVESIDLVGLKHIRPAALQEHLGVNVGDEVDGRTALRLSERAAARAAHSGFPLSEVRLEQAPGDAPSSIAYRLHVTEGPAVRIERVDVAGRPPVAWGILAEGIYAKAGAIADQERLEQDRKLLVSRLKAHGFWRAQVQLLPPIERPAGARICFRVDAHERLRFHFRGNRHFPDHVLFAAWPNEIEGGPEALMPLFRQRLEAMYAREGFVDARVSMRLLPAHAADPGFVPERRTPRSGWTRKRTDDLLFKVDEGAPLWVRSLALEGNSAFPGDVFRQQVRGRLSSEVSRDNLFSPLGPAWQAHNDAALRGLEPASPTVPAEDRYVADVYGEAVGDVASALAELGFGQAKTHAPTLSLVGPAAGTPPAPLASGDESDGVGGPLSRRRGSVRPAAIVDADAQVHVHDGMQAFVERITFRGNQSFSAAELRAIVAGATASGALTAPLTPGAPWSPAAAEDARIAITKALRNLGHLYVRVDSQVESRGHHGERVCLTFDIAQGPRVTMQHVLIRGNTFTRTGVIQSRLSLRPGRVYRLEQAVDDQQQVMALGTFTRVRVRLVDEEHQSERKDVVVEVEERPRQLIEVMPGLSSTQGPRLSSSYTHLNAFGTASTFVASLKLNRQMFFGLFGRYASNLRARYRAWHGWRQLTHAIEREVRLGLRAPPLRALPFDPLFRIDVVEQRINAVRYGLDAATVTLGADLRFLRRLTGALEVQGGIASLECPLGDNCEDTRGELRRLRGGRPIQQGRYDTIKVGPWLRFEGRNDPISPSRGWLLWARVTQVFGQARRRPADFAFQFLKYEAQATTYVPLGRPVLALGLRFGTNQIQRSQVPVDERFFLGGRDSLRGFVEGTLIPDDACVVEADGDNPPGCAETIVRTGGAAPLSLGGNTFGLLKTELRVPVRGGLSFEVFADIGNLWVDAARIKRFRLRSGVGAGFRYATPVGAMTLDFGVNPRRRPQNGEAPWQVHFSIGSF